MKVLLDTHVLIWFAEGSDKLSEKAKSEIDNPNNFKFISIASLWEIVIKSSRQKLELKKSFVEINEFLYLNNFEVLSIEIKHLNSLLNLPYHHSDPFDRLIISQAVSDNFGIISIDRHFSSYPVNVIW